MDVILILSDPSFTGWLFETIKTVQNPIETENSAPQSIQTVDTRTDERRYNERGQGRGGRLFGSALRESQQRSRDDGHTNGGSRQRKVLDGSHRQHPYGGAGGGRGRPQNNTQASQGGRGSIFERAGVAPGQQQPHYNPAFFDGGGDTSDFTAAREGNIILTPDVARCRHWPNCQLGQRCRFHHPSHVCPNYPDCPNTGGTCANIHPGEDMPEDQVPHYLQAIQNGNRPFQQHTHHQVQHANNGLNPQAPAFASEIPTKPELPDSCKFGIKCTNAYCKYSHPTPAATVESALVLSEDACENGAQCKDAECVKSHPSPAIARGLANGGVLKPATTPRPVSGTNKVPEPCRFGNDCTRAGCYYIHPWDAHIAKAMGLPMSSVPCRFGSSCTKGSTCPFWHYRSNRSTAFGGLGDKHISDRSFSVPEGKVEQLQAESTNGQTTAEAPAVTTADQEMQS